MQINLILSPIFNAYSLPLSDPIIPLIPVNSKPSICTLHFPPPYARISPLGGAAMIKRSLTLSLCILALAVSTLAHKTSAKMSSAPVPDKACMQKIWDAWASLTPANAAQFYAKGSHVFFDIAPLKYASWDEYQKGATALEATYQSATFTVNDDAQIHNAGQIVWGTATV